ncbi:MAG: prolipoprotein diacylglyceryl transferase [Reichenbachiella sp.]
MHPILFSFDNINIHSYGILIALGAITVYFFAQYKAKHELGIDPYIIQALARIIIIGALVGGKFFFYLENPSFYFASFENLKHDFRNGFVFYGSLVTVVPLVIWYVRKKKVPVWPLMDLMAFVALILHAFGRVGCFMAGCCYGKETDGPIFISFSDPISIAPTGVHLHPTQLYSVTLLLSIFAVLWMFKRHKRFEGQIFLLYIMLYSVGRSIIEIFRGDVSRGYVIDNWVSHSQAIALVLISIMAMIYVNKLKKSKPSL